MVAATRSVVLSGASTGIGAACALHLDRAGYRVFAGVRREEDGDRLRSRASAQLTPLLLDVTIPEHIVSARDAVSGLVGADGLYGLVNNAGIAVACPVEALPMDALRLQFEVNVVGAVALTQTFLPLLRAGHGRIVNMSSISGRVAFPILGAYAASKFALEGLSEALRIELRAQQIPVSLVEPGVVATPIWERSTARARDLQSAAPGDWRRLYGDLSDAVERFAERAREHALPAEAVARVVARVLAAPRPRARYCVGAEARWAGAVLPLLPAWLRDRLVLLGLRLRT